MKNTSVKLCWQSKDIQIQTKKKNLCEVQVIVLIEIFCCFNDREFN